MAEGEINVTTVYLLLERLEKKVDTGFTGVNARLDKTNGRIGAHETEIAVLKVARLAEPSSSTAGWWGAGASAAVVGALEIGKAVVSLWSK